MGNSKKSHVSNRVAGQLLGNELNANNLLAHFEDKLYCIQAKHKKILLALSGGLDSTVLLHLLCSVQSQKSSASFSLSAMHVHHGLSANSDEWAHFCHELCAGFGVTLLIKHIQIPFNNALGTEAAARKLRYEALYSAEADYICLAHHQDDQAETMLLQLARGAGVKGLALMATCDEKRKLLRPLLDVPRAVLEAYAQQHHLRWVNDESNQNIKFDRNFIRHEVMPVLNKRYLSIAKTLGRTAAHMAEASNLLDDLAEIDSQTYINHSQLNLEALNYLSTSRAKNLLRWWIAQRALQMPSTEQLQQIYTQLTHAKLDAKIKLRLGDGFTIQCYQKKAYLIAEQPPIQAINLLWQGESKLDLPDNGSLEFTQKQGAGLVFSHLDKPLLRVKYREGGERFKPELNRPTRTLKHLLQGANMPTWQRDQMPLIYLEEKLVIVPNLGVDATMQAKSNEIGWNVAWKMPDAMS